MSEPTVLRDAKDSDEGFICDTWTENFKPHSMLCRVGGMEAYRRFMRHLVRRLCGEPGAKSVVLADAVDTWQIAGFCILTGPELHYVFVRESLRGHGLAKQMLQAVEIRSHSFTTPDFKKRVKPLDRGWEFKPRFTL